MAAGAADGLAAGAVGELNELLWALPISLDPREIAAALLERGARLFRSPLAALWVTQDDAPELVGAFGLTDKKAEQLWAGLELGTCPPQPLNLFADRLAGAGAFGKRRLGALLATPLSTPTGPVGWLVFARLEAEPYSEFEEQLIGIISNRVALALENARLYRQSEARSRDMSVLADCTEILMSTMGLQDLLDAVTQRMTEAFGLTLCTIQLLDPASGTLPPTAVYHRDPEQRLRLSTWLSQRPLRRDQSMTGRLFATRQPYVTPNLAEDPLVAPDIREQMGAGSTLALPLLVRGEPVGAMYWFKAGRASGLDASLVPLATQLAGQIAMALEKARLYEALARRADEGDSQLQTVYEDVTARLTEGRRHCAELERTLRADVEGLTQALRAPGAGPEVEAAIARLTAHLDLFKHRLAEGDQRPF